MELLRTYLVSSCGLKKKETIIVAFHFMKRRLKIELGEGTRRWHPFEVTLAGLGGSRSVYLAFYNEIPHREGQ